MVQHAMKKTTSKRLGPPFGTGVERFLGLGYHPGFEVRLGTFKYPEIFPGCYEWNKPPRIVSKISRWQRQLETEEYSRMLGYRCSDILKKRRWMNSVNGPGWQELPASVPKRTVTFPRGKRFPISKAKSFAVPGPGTYGKYHVPHVRMEEKSRSKGFSHSILPSFEQSGRGARSLGLQRSYHLPPNLYHLKSSTDELILKRVSKRGPYDLFSADRFPDVPVRKMSLLTFRMDPSDLKHPKNSFKGKFLSCGKESRVTLRIALKDTLVNKDPLDPGPNYYDPYPAAVVTQATSPFSSSVKKSSPSEKCGIHPPPGRYNLEFKKRIPGDGFRSVFLSNTKREVLKVVKHSWYD